MIEVAIVLPVFLVLVLGMLDLGIGVLRHHLLSEAARHGARQAIVHGALAPSGWNGGQWGPSMIDVAATANGIPIVADVQPFLTGCDLSQSRVRVEWLDGNNSIESRVRVTVEAPYQPMMTFIFGNPTFTLTASSTMPIAH